ncbi:MAG: hypothetical protein LBU06_06025 [Desulfovibrio sp.]|jgi:hypothetical protein|nr:hypothetical protein [Desulfovibrio sp.]
MSSDWKILFSKAHPAFGQGCEAQAPLRLASMSAFRSFLDWVHIKYCLARPFCEQPDYPLVELRELMPSFEPDLWEYKHLPGFSLVALARPVCNFTEIFQYDSLLSPDENLRADLVQQNMVRNLGVVQSRLPRDLHESLRRVFEKQNVADLAIYPDLHPFLVNMDRAQVFGMHGPHPHDMSFCLAGVYASFPSDLDTEVKRYGLRIGKFRMDDPDAYDQNRNFVLQHLMELYGFPVSSERRTSAALFARRLHKIGEHFLIRVLGQSDRTLTTIYGDASTRLYPQVDKIALVHVDDDQEDLDADKLLEKGFFLDPERRVAILRVNYQQHKFSPENVRQERALSVRDQEIIHPLTGEAVPCGGLARSPTNMYIRLNDIVNGEYFGRAHYKRNELIENTDTEEKRLKFLYFWLSKHQRRIIGYSDEFFAHIDKVVSNYLLSPEKAESFQGLAEYRQETLSRYNYILQARKVRMLEDLLDRNVRGRRIGYAEMLAAAVSLLHALKFEIVDYFDALVATVIAIGESILNDRYLVRVYIERNESGLTRNGLEIRRNYGKLVALIDEFKSIRKLRTGDRQTGGAKLRGGTE